MDRIRLDIFQMIIHDGPRMEPRRRRSWVHPKAGNQETPPWGDVDDDVFWAFPRFGGEDGGFSGI